MTRIITTIGPASFNPRTLEFFAKHNVAIARMNFSHNTPDWHKESALESRKQGLELLFDLPGPKIRLGEIANIETVKIGDEILLEMQHPEQTYPYKIEVAGTSRLVFPLQFHVQDFVQPGHHILVDDGKLDWEVEKVADSRVFCKVAAGGVVKSRKGMNMPQTHVDIDFLGERDRMMLDALFVELKPEYVAISFVQKPEEVTEIKTLLTNMLNAAGVTGYFPKICTKLEMSKAVETDNLANIVEQADLIMIARGDLALETQPAHIMVPFLQEKIKQECRLQNKPFVIATQVLESMMDCPVPTRAEVSDLYRAVIIDKADYVMLSGESAGGSYPLESVKLMSDMIELSK